MKRSGFTMIELVFVIVILGILAAIAIPKFTATRDDAQIAKGKSDVAAIRAAIVNERQSRLLRGMSSYATKLDNATPDTDGQTLFDKNPSGGTLLMYGVTSKQNTDGHWNKSDDTEYEFQVMKQKVTFTYTPDDGTFACAQTGATKDLCIMLSN